MRIVSWTALLVVLPCLVLLADDPVRKLDKKKVIDAKAEVQWDQVDEIYFAKIKLQNFSVASNATVNVEMKNPFEKDIKFSGVSSKCVCKQFKMRNSVIPAGDTTVVSFDIDIPPRHRSAIVDTNVILVDKGSSVIRLELNYGLDGLLAFSEMISVVRFDDIDEQEKVLTVPFLATRPVDIANVKAFTSDNLSGVSVAVLEDEKKGPVVKLSIPESVLKTGNIRGELYLSHEETDQTDTYLLTVKDARTSEISPRIINFRKRDGRWSATAIVKIAGNLDTSESTNKSPIECRFGEHSLALDLKKLTNNTFRVTIAAEESVFANLKSNATDSKIDWLISNGSNQSQLQTQFIVDQ